MEEHRKARSTFRMRMQVRKYLHSASAQDGVREVVRGQGPWWVLGAASSGGDGWCGCAVSAKLQRA